MSVLPPAMLRDIATRAKRNKNMTTLYNKPGVPHKDWLLENYEDSGELNHECDMCGTPIRHLYTMSHIDYPQIITVGSTCTENIGMKSVIRKFQYYLNRWQHKHLGQERMYHSKHLNIELVGKDYYKFYINNKTHPFWHAKSMLAAKLKLYKELQK